MATGNAGFSKRGCGSPQYRLRLIPFLFLISILLLLPCPVYAAWGAAEAIPGELWIIVKEEQTGNVSGNALVYLDGSAAGLTSERDGQILLEHVSSGKHSIRVTKEGFVDGINTVVFEKSRNLTILIRPSPVIPLVTHGPAEEKIDIVFVPSETRYDCTNQKKVPAMAYTTDEALFRQDVIRLISVTLLSLDTVTSESVGLPSDYRDRFNFYYFWDRDHFADAFDGCPGTLPLRFWETAPYADVAIIVYPTYGGRYTGIPCEPIGCANGLGPGTQSWFKIPADSDRLFFHESGHVVFGLLDTYCGDTYYQETAPYPNIWGTEASCRKSAAGYHWNSSACSLIASPGSVPGGESCIKPFWRYDPEPDVMGTGAYSGAFGDASTTRIRFILDSFGRGEH